MELKNPTRQRYLNDLIDLSDPHKFLILGDDERELSELFYAFIRNKSGLDDTLKEKVRVLAGYCLEPGFPAGKVLERYSNDKDAWVFWVGSLMFALLGDTAGTNFWEIVVREMDREAADLFLSDENIVSLPQWLSYVRGNPETLGWVLDAYDERLEREDEWVIVGYGGLGRMVEERERLVPYLRSLLHFWLTQQRRWSRICGKIFLERSLLLDGVAAFQDGAKLSAYTVDCRVDRRY